MSPTVSASQPQRQRDDTVEAEFIRKFGRVPTEEEKRLWHLGDAVLGPLNQESDTAESIDRSHQTKR